jgi:NTP pyrophosphatase (non-canonical NTP hydrolase)
MEENTILKATENNSGADASYNFLADLQKEIHSIARDKGFYEEKRNIPTRLMLIVSEIAEAMEADRKNNYALGNGHILGVLGWTSDKDFIEHFERTEKDTFQDELADAVIRILDLAEAEGIDLHKHILAKIRYNKTRELKHGKKY